MAQQWSQQWLLLVLASRLSTRMQPCWSTLDFYINVEHFQPMVIPTPGLLLVLASRLLRIRPTVSGSPKPPWPPSSPALQQVGSDGLLRPHPVTPHPSHLCGWWTDQGTLFSFVLSPFSPRVLRSPTVGLAVRNASFVAGSFARPSSPCAPLPVSPLPCLCSDTVWLVLWLVTVLQGPCQ